MNEHVAVELERKYEIVAGVSVPSDFSAVGLRLGETEVFKLKAVYFDTLNFDLAANACALRRRFGGGDDGWHFKQKIAGGSNEYTWPLSDTFPEPALETVAELTGIADARLEPIVELETIRTQRELLDTAGNLRCFLVDDLVSAFDGVDKVARSWREWEVELASGEEETLDGVEKILLQAGAFLSPNNSKIARARGVAANRLKGFPLTEKERFFLQLSEVADRMQGNSEVDELFVKNLRDFALTLLAKE